MLRKKIANPTTTTTTTTTTTVNKLNMKFMSSYMKIRDSLLVM